MGNNQTSTKKKQSGYPTTTYNRTVDTWSPVVTHQQSVAFQYGGVLTGTPCQNTRQQQQHVPTTVTRVDSTRTQANRNTATEWEFVEANSTLARNRIANRTQSSHVRHEQIRIQNDAIGHSYEKVFGSILDSKVTVVVIDDPYIRLAHQIYNFLRFCELLVKSCKNLKEIYLKTTGQSNTDKHQQQLKSLTEIKQSLMTNGIRLNVEFSNTLHDREITFDNGCTVKIGRGLDYFKKTTGRFAIGFCDQDLRKCFTTTVDIYRH